jgi:hypothetical protein
VVESAINAVDAKGELFQGKAKQPRINAERKLRAVLNFFEQFRRGKEFDDLRERIAVVEKILLAADQSHCTKPRMRFPNTGDKNMSAVSLLDIRHAGPASSHLTAQDAVSGEVVSTLH